jgi:hypothetical protein
MAPVKVNQANAAVLPDPSQAAAVVTESAPRIAPGKRFIIRYAAILPDSAKLAGRPVAEIVFDVGDDNGFGSVTVQIRPETGATPALRAEMTLNQLNDCVQVERRVFSDGSVAVYYPLGSPSQERQATHVWYFGVRGFTLYVITTPQGWGASGGDESTASPLPARRDQPLTPAQVTELADVIAHSGPSVTSTTPRVASS